MTTTVIEKHLPNYLRIVPDGTSVSAKPAIWIIGGDAKMRSRISTLLAPMPSRIVNLDPAHEAYRSQVLEGPRPDLIVLDIGEDADWGMEAIQELKRRRVAASIVVLTGHFSKEFGAKILSQGVRYYFSHDFLEEEFLDVAKNLLQKEANSPLGPGLGDGRRDQIRGGANRK